MSLSAHQSLSRRSKGEGEMRSILSSMDNLHIRDGDKAQVVEPPSKPSQPTTRPQLACQKCTTQLKGVSHRLSEVDCMGVCCKKCYKQKGVLKEVYCTGCAKDLCGTCQRYFCNDCLEEVDLKDREGNRYCSRKCAKASRKKQGSSQSSPTKVAVRQSHLPARSFLSHFHSTNNPFLQLSNPHTPNPQPSAPVMKYACDWCTQGLASKTSGPQRNTSTDLGYYCKSNCSRRVYCNGCVRNHGDFCAGANCQQFVCRNCCPYDAWLVTDDKAVAIYCSKACAPSGTCVVRRHLFDEDWEAEEHFRPLSRRCQGFSMNGERCKVTAAHPGAAARSLKQGDDFCVHHGGLDGGVSVSDVDDESDGTDYYFN